MNCFDCGKKCRGKRCYSCWKKEWVQCSCGKLVMPHLAKRRRCIFCATFHIWKAKTRHLKMRGKIQDYLCRHCNKRFCVSPVKGKKIPSSIRNRIISLSKINKGYINKHDSFRNTAYTTREISKFIGVGKTFVAYIIKNGIN